MLTNAPDDLKHEKTYNRSKCEYKIRKCMKKHTTEANVNKKLGNVVLFIQDNNGRQN
jgi:hypothetical protein